MTKEEVEQIADEVDERRGKELLRRWVMSKYGYGDFDLFEADAELERTLERIEEELAQERKQKRDDQYA